MARAEGGLARADGGLLGAAILGAPGVMRARPPDRADWGLLVALLGRGDFEGRLKADGACPRFCRARAQSGKPLTTVEILSNSSSFNVRHFVIQATRASRATILASEVPLSLLDL